MLNNIMPAKFKKWFKWKAVVLSCFPLSSIASSAEWQTRYYTDDFGDVMYDHPFQETRLQGVGHSLSLYIRLMSNPAMAFELILADGSRHITASAADNTNSISVKDAFGNITKIDISPDHESDGRLYIAGDDVVKFAEAIDKGDCKIKLTTVTYFDSYRNPGNYLFLSNSETNGILAMLYANAIYNDYVENEFMTQSMGDFSGSYILKGQVDGDGITMKLTFDGRGTVTGSCNYDGERSWNSVNGDLAILGQMSIAEYSSGGIYEWEYSGQFNGKVFRGDRIDPDRGTTVPFYLTVQ